MSVSISFSGAFFAWPYHAGVAAFIQDRGGLAPDARIYGTSSGAVVATMLACGMDITQRGLPQGMRADRDGMGGKRLPFLQPRAFLAPHITMMDDHLPPDAHERAHGRLFITLRRLPTLRQAAISDFPSRAALFDVLAASIAVPGLTVPLYHRSPRYGACLDGGPGVPDDDRPGRETIRVGVLARGRYHIRPSVAIGASLVLGLPDDAVRQRMFEQGRRDAAAFFATEGRALRGA